MKIVLTGGGTGGHFYPIIGVAQELNRMADSQKLVDMKLYFMSDAPYDERALFENSITFVKVEAGKQRTYASVKNWLDIVKTGFGAVRAVMKMFLLYPDVVFSKGGYASFPALVAARFFRIPVFIHESDSVPGRVNAWSAKFATRIYVAFPEAAKQFPQGKTVLVGIPMREELVAVTREGAFEALGLDPALPVLFVQGGSQGSQLINESIVDILPELVQNMQVVHQTGRANYKEVSGRAEVVLRSNLNKSRYQVFDFLDASKLRMIAGVATVIVSRAGATSIFEIAQWGVPAILIPITDSHGDHQRKNAFAYARAGGASVVEERNLTPHILSAEIARLIGNKEERIRMKTSAKAFALPNAGERIARDIIELSVSHES